MYGAWSSIFDKQRLRALLVNLNAKSLSCIYEVLFGVIIALMNIFSLGDKHRHIVTLYYGFRVYYVDRAHGI